MAGILVEAITEYGRDAKAGRIACLVEACPLCGGVPGRFWRNGVRARLFLVFAEVVCRVWSHLTRWRCPLCRQTFTLYPDFALPHKRYPAPFVLARCGAYASDGARTYREGVLEEGMPVGHADADAGMELSASTLWRWVGTLGGLVEAERRLLDLVKQKDPSTVLFRALAGVRIREGKYRGEGRRQMLAGCWRLALVEAEHVRLFAVSVFTEFATWSGFL
jgi:hypothetical protein